MLRRSKWQGQQVAVTSGKDGEVIRVKYQVASVAMVKASVEKSKAVAGGAETEQWDSGWCKCCEERWSRC